MSTGTFWFGKEYKCPICGKTFWVADSSQWVYKQIVPFKMFCSYTCYRTYQKEQEAKQKKKRKRER